MAWETRRGRGAYYTRTQRVDGRFRRIYVGTGPVAELAAAADALRRAERRAHAEAQRSEAARFEAAVTPLRRLCQLTELLTRAALVAAGYHRHDRGVWRRRRRSTRHVES